MSLKFRSSCSQMWHFQEHLWWLLLKVGEMSLLKKIFPCNWNYVFIIFIFILILLLLAWQKCPRISFLMFYFKEYYRKQCIMRNFSWNSKKPSSCPEMFCSKDVFENVAKFLRKLLSRSLLFNEVAEWTTSALLKSAGDFLWILQNSHNLLHNPIVIWRDFTCF